MAKPDRVLDDHELKAILDAEKASAKADGGSDLAKQRSDALDYYMGDLKDHMPAPEGRSEAVSTVVADTVDAMLPSLMDIFASTDEIAKFEAVGPEDENAAIQETDYVNHVFYNDNPGFLTLYSVIKDALIQKNGILKFWWEDAEEEKRETYSGLSADGFALLSADESVELIEHTEHPDGTHDATVIARKPSGGIKVMAVPPEEFLISRRARSIQDSPYCAHVTKKTASELIASGYDQSVIDDLPFESGQATGTEEISRNTVEDEETNTSIINKAMREIEVTEHYIRVDYDGDGVAELRKVTTAGSKTHVLDNEACDRMPFAGGTPIIMSHRFWGRGIADVVMDLQRIQTALIRAVLDNVYFANNGRMEVAESHATEHTIDDLLTNRPGGLVRTKAPGGLLPIGTAPIGNQIFPVIEYMDGQRDIRTGIQRYAAGPDANSLNPFNSTATGANIVATHAQQRLRLIARVLAETLIKDTMLGIHELMLKHGTGARHVKLREQWVEVDPRNWKTRKDMTIMVGLGTGTRDQMHNMLTTLLQTQVKAIEMQGGAKGPVVQLENVYNTLKKMVENAGFRSADPFFTNPAGAPPVEPPPNPDVMKAQAEIEGKKAELQMKQQDGQNKLSLEAQRAQQQLAIEQERMVMGREKLQAEIQMERERMAFEFQLKQEEHALTLQLKQQEHAESMMLKRASAANDAQIRRETTESKAEFAAKE